jgi:hypothetical protein
MLKNSKGGGFNNVIKRDIPCYDLIKSSNKDDIISTNWHLMPKPIDTDLDVNKMEYAMCNHINNTGNRNICNNYINQCKVKKLYEKYVDSLNDTSKIKFTLETLNEILMKTIPYTNTERDVDFLLLIGATLTTIPYGRFSHNMLTSISIPRTVTEISTDAFSHNKLTSVNIPNSVTRIGVDAFANNNLRNIKIPNSVTEIWHYAFQNNRLLSIKIPNSVTYIGTGAFYNNDLLASIRIPSRFEHQMSHFFDNIQNIEEIIFYD